ncbi:MAG: 3-phosphoshikimate 1-carboxyvinyltransferase, partial [Clostridia bacterium]|nr:3-phosphoshikimate 1-carboxyvinyltransferase [Clostridia bacterium]
MNITFNPSPANGKIKAISSKSVAHRILICASFANAPTKIQCDTTNKDICATADCLRALGAKIEYNAPYFYVEPIKKIQREAVLECGESASTLRFILPIISALGVNGRFNMKGRLPERPLSPLYEELTAHGASLSPQSSNPLISSGKLTGDEYRIKGNISSQFISGLIFALTLSGMGGRIIIEGKLESAPYVDM